MSEPLLIQTVPPFQMTVFYEPPLGFRVVVQHESDETKRATEYTECNHEPIFGIDIGDMIEIRAAAERMCRDLEARAGEKP
jgi:hypothetical protein